MEKESKSKFRKIWCVPDIHGEAEKLRKALDILRYDGLDLTQDALIFLGDMIDRGPDSKGVLDQIKSLKDAHSSNVIVLRGNHEDLAVDYYVKKFAHSWENWYMNGGRNTEWSYPEELRMSTEHIKFIASLPYSFEADGFFFSHAPVPRDKQRNFLKQVGGFSQYTVHELTWTYMDHTSEHNGGLFDQHEGPWSKGGLGKDNLIGLCGHIHRGPKVREIRVFPNYRLLDVGCGCWEAAPLAIHECKSGETIYVT